MHYHNRVTGFNDAYFARKNTAFPNGHINVGSFQVQYDQYEGFESRADLSFPHLPPNEWYMIDLFPGMNFNLRGSAYRCRWHRHPVRRRSPMPVRLLARPTLRREPDCQSKAPQQKTQSTYVPNDIEQSKTDETAANTSKTGVVCSWVGALDPEHRGTLKN